MKIDDCIDDEDGTITDTPLEIFYAELEHITADEGGFLRIVGDDGPSFIEIRVPFEALEKMGWARPDITKCDACGKPITEDQENVGHECDLHAECVEKGIHNGK